MLRDSIIQHLRRIDDVNITQFIDEVNNIDLIISCFYQYYNTDRITILRMSMYNLGISREGLYDFMKYIENDKYDLIRSLCHSYVLSTYDNIYGRIAFMLCEPRYEFIKMLDLKDLKSIIKLCIIKFCENMNFRRVISYKMQYKICCWVNEIDGKILKHELFETCGYNGCSKSNFKKDYKSDAFDQVWDMLKWNDELCVLCVMLQCNKLNSEFF